MKSKILTLLVICAFASPASAQTDHSVFGIELGKPLRAPECPIAKIGRHTYTYTRPDSTVCFKRHEFLFSPTFDHLVTTLPLNETISLVFPKVPAIMRGDELGAMVVNGNVEYVAFNTMGVAAAADALAALQAKYGAPTSQVAGEAQNLVGAKFPTITATWVLSDLSVSFQSVGTKVDIGDVVIGTAKGMAARKALLDSVYHRIDRPKL